MFWLTKQSSYDYTSGAEQSFNMDQLGWLWLLDSASQISAQRRHQSRSHYW